MAINKDDLVEIRTEYSNELASLDVLELRISALLNDASKCIVNITNCNDKIREMPINSDIYKSNNDINSLASNIETWKEKVTILKKEIEERRKNLNNLIETIDKKIDKFKKKEEKYE